MKLSLCARTLLMFGVAAHFGVAAPILWSLPPVTLEGCCLPPGHEQTATVTGSFVFDPVTQLYSDWDLTISGYTLGFTPLNTTLTPATSAIIFSNPSFLHIAYPLSPQGDLVFTFGLFTPGGLIPIPLTPAGGTVPVLVSNGARFASFNAGGRSEVSSVPEPIAGLLVLAGACILCFWKRESMFRSQRR